MQNNRTQISLIVVLGSLAVMGWTGFLVASLRKEKPIQIPAPVVNVSSPPTTVTQTGPTSDGDPLLMVSRLPNNPTSNGKQPDSMVSIVGSYTYSSYEGSVRDAVERIVKENAEKSDVRILFEQSGNEAEIAAALKSPRPSRFIDWRVIQVQKKGIEWRARLPFARTADPKARQLVDAERGRRIEKIVAAADSGGNG